PVAVQRCTLRERPHLPPLSLLPTPRPPPSTLFPYTTLFRSHALQYAGPPVGRAAAGLGDLPPDQRPGRCRPGSAGARPCGAGTRSEEHTSELQSRSDLVCRLLLEKKKKQRYTATTHQTRSVP